MAYRVWRERWVLILVIDNFDSFVFNLARYCRRLGHGVRVVRNDAITVDQILSESPSAIVLSPGPCAPEQAGISLELVRRAAGKIPILGVCLGHQTIAQALGAAIVRSPQPMHGQWDWIVHDEASVFMGLPNPLPVGRYHSLVAAPEPWPSELRITARTREGIIMAIEHRHWPLIGWQFHPESILTPSGYALLAAAFRRFGISPSRSPMADASELANLVSDDVRIESERFLETERLWRSESRGDIDAQLRQDRSLDQVVTAFGGTWREVGEPFIPEPTDEQDQGLEYPRPWPEGRGGS